MSGLALVGWGIAALVAAFAYLVVSAPPLPLPAEPVEPAGYIYHCAPCGGDVRSPDLADVVAHLRTHAEPAEVTEDFAAWQAEVDAWRKERSS